MDVFTVSGPREGRQATVAFEWTPGLTRPAAADRLSGDPRAIAAVRRQVAKRVAVSLTPTGPYFPASLAEPPIALLTVLSVFDDRGVKVSGDVPELELEPLPPDVEA